MARKRIESRLLSGDPEQEREQLLVLMILNKKSPTLIANDLGIRPQSVSGVIHRRDNSRRVIRYFERLPKQLMV